jgi:hypothetical protein
VYANVGSFEELMAIIGAGYVAGKAVWTAVSKFIGWLKEKGRRD